MAHCKAELRTTLRRQCTAYASSHSQPVDQCGFFHPEFLRRVLAAKCVAGYLPVGAEADITTVLDMLSLRNVPLALPFLGQRDSLLMFRHYECGDPLVVAPFGFRQPAPTAVEVQPDVILVPLVGFDRTLNRLGQGAGHYDRLMATLPDAYRIGIAWSMQEVEQVPVDDWDMPLDAVATEKEWIVAVNNRISA